MSTLQQFEVRRIRDFHSRNENPIKKLSWERIKERIKNYVVLFLETSSIHGFNHLVNAGRHPCEIFIWLMIVALSLYGTVYIALTTWARFQSSPTVISMDRDMYTWSTPFPCITIFPDQKIDPTKLEQYLRDSKEVDKEKLKTFIMALANATYENFDTVPEYDGIEPQDYMETLLNLTPPFKPTITIGAAGVYLQKVPTITEMGLCYTINSQISVYNSPEYRRANKWNVLKSINSSITFHPLDGEVFAQVLNILSSYNAYVHGPLEVPDIAAKYHHSPSFFYMKIVITATVVYTSKNAASLSVSQRRCRFETESNLKHNAVYSYALCRMECRIQLCLKYCQCIPHYYRRIGDEKICDVKGLHCLSKYKDVLINLRHEGGQKVDCTCFPICHNANYITQSFALERWVLGTNLQWGMISYPRIRYRRDIIFGFTDFLAPIQQLDSCIEMKNKIERGSISIQLSSSKLKLFDAGVDKIMFSVAVGGMAGLFLGCSVLSFMEIVYFMTLRLLYYTRNTVDK